MKHEIFLRKKTALIKTKDLEFNVQRLVTGYYKNTDLTWT